MIEVENVSLKYNKQRILHNISLKVGKGNITGLIGVNGSGKTMLMKCICGFNNAFTGSIKVLGKEIGKDIDFPENTGFIIETPGFIPYYSGYKNLMLLAELQKKIGKEEIEETMRLVGLDPDMKKVVKKYSLGMRQRLGLAQALMENPEVLILDEPFNGLDKHGVAEMREVFLQLKKQGKAILLSSHNWEDIKILCDEIYEMDGGELFLKS